MLKNVYSLLFGKSRGLTKGAAVKKNKKNQKTQQKDTKKLTLQRETLRALEEGKLEVVAGGASRCPTACSVC
jgi:hypothetical protein